MDTMQFQQDFLGKVNDPWTPVVFFKGSRPAAMLMPQRTEYNVALDLGVARHNLRL